ncbi:hypothetical protein WS46_32070 [Burkholderia sp. RF4-BP95]|nr:hypothetical protein WS46_32070 [Burkholderia sp. RF4-BP95]
MLVMFVLVELVMLTLLALEETYSPQLPAFALSFVAVPTMPPVLCGVIAAVNVRPPTVVPKTGSAPVDPTST